VTESHFSIDGREYPCDGSRTILEEALEHDVYIPHLCAHPELAPFGSCRVCMVRVNGRLVAACTHRVKPGDAVENRREELDLLRRRIVQMLFAEGNHFCPGCELSGNCQLQALAYWLDIEDPFFNFQYPRRNRDGSHPDLFLDLDRCIDCGLCARSHREIDGKNALALSGRGEHTTLIATSASGKLADTDLDERDRAANVCPVGALIHKRGNYSQPIGSRLYDRRPIDEVGNRFAHPFSDNSIPRHEENHERKT
jgi:[NiFe] hydrogenase diaphorase moiety small subunit